MQKKILIKATREYLQNIFPENLLPIKKLNKKHKKLLVYKTRGLKRKIKKAEQQVFKQYFKYTRTLSSNEILLPKKVIYNSQFANPAPFLYSIDQIKSELIKKQVKTSDFKSQLKERKKLSILYGNLSKKQIQKISTIAYQFNGKIHENLLLILESRLDILLFKACFFPSIYSARQWICHNKILVNSKCVNIPSYQIKPGDIISIKPQYRLNFFKQMLDFLKKHFYTRNSRYIIPNSLLKKLKKNTRLNVYTFKTFYFSKKPAKSLFKNLSQVKKVINAGIKKYERSASLPKFVSKPLYTGLDLSKVNLNKTFLINTLNVLNESFFVSPVKQHNRFRDKQSLSLQTKFVCKQLPSKANKELSNSSACNLTLLNKKVDATVSLTQSMNDTKQKKKLLIHLKLEKLFLKNRARRHTFSALQRSILKPINIEVSYKNLTLIYLYSPQKLAFPCTLNLELITRSLR